MSRERREEGGTFLQQKLREGRKMINFSYISVRTVAPQGRGLEQKVKISRHYEELRKRSCGKRVNEMYFIRCQQNYLAGRG